MKTDSLKKTAICLLAGAFLAGSVYAGTTGTSTTTKKTTTPAKTTTAKNDLFGDSKDVKKDKTSPIPAAGWNGTMTVTTDASGNPTATFANDLDKKQYNVQIDDTAKRILANIKTGSKVQIKGSSIVKADGKLFVKLTDCNALPDTPAAPATPPAQ